MVIIGFLIMSVVPLSGLIYFTYRTVRNYKGRRALEWRMKIGTVCYGCQDRLTEEPSIMDYASKALSEKARYTLCISCKRDEDIDRITGRTFYRVKKWLRLFIIKDFAKYSIAHFAVVVAGLTIGIVTGTHFVSAIVNYANLAFSYVNYRRSLMITDDKEEDF